MIVEAKNRLHVIVELSKEELYKVIRGEDLVRSSSDNDKPVFIQIYCCDPNPEFLPYLKNQTKC